MVSPEETPILKASSGSGYALWSFALEVSEMKKLISYAFYPWLFKIRLLYFNQLG